jgi:uncharacterized protein (DUF3084 family)
MSGNNRDPRVSQSELAISELRGVQKTTLVAVLSGFRLLQQDLADVMVDLLALRKAVIETDATMASHYKQCLGPAEQNERVRKLRDSMKDMTDMLATLPEDGDGWRG